MSLQELADIRTNTAVAWSNLEQVRILKREQMDDIQTLQRDKILNVLQENRREQVAKRDALIAQNKLVPMSMQIDLKESLDEITAHQRVHTASNSHAQQLTDLDVSLRQIGIGLWSNDSH